jgi:hypothetical protein
LRPKNHFLAGLAVLSKNKKENRCEGQDDLQVFTFCLPHREKYAISLLWLALFTDQFTFEAPCACSFHESYHLTIPSQAGAAAAAGW